VHISLSFPFNYWRHFIEVSLQLLIEDESKNIITGFSLITNMKNQETLGFDLHDDILLGITMDLPGQKLVLRIQKLKWIRVPDSDKECYRPENWKIIEIHLTLKTKPEISCSFDLIHQEILWCYLHGDHFELTLVQGNLACYIESFEIIECGTERNLNEQITKVFKPIQNQE
jgi:hypothetical protein